MSQLQASLIRSLVVIAFAFNPCIVLQDNVKEKGNRSKDHNTIMITITLKNCFAKQNSCTKVKLPPKCRSTCNPLEIDPQCNVKPEMKLKRK